MAPMVPRAAASAPARRATCGRAACRAATVDDQRVRVAPPTPTMEPCRAPPSRARARSAAFFDLDKTIIAKSSTLAFSKPFQAGGLITRGAVLRSAYAQFVYLVGGADHDQMEKMRAVHVAAVRGLGRRDGQGDRRRDPARRRRPARLRRGRHLIEEHHAAGRDVVIVSTCGAEVVEPIGEMLGADQVIATRMEVVDGKYTGEIDYYAYAENKAARSASWPPSAATTSTAATPTATRSPTCRCSRRSATRTRSTPTGSCASSRPRRAGRCCVFTRPVALRSRIPAKPTLAALTIGTAVTLGGALWFNRRRRLGASRLNAGRTRCRWCRRPRSSPPSDTTAR